MKAKAFERKFDRGEDVSKHLDISKAKRVGLMTERWTNGPGATYPAHEHPYDKRLVVERGSITFHLTREGRDVVLRAGERLELPVGTPHAATVGPDGVTCVETHVPAGT